MGQIPWSAIDSYAKRMGVDDPDEFDQLVKLVRICDDVLLDHVKRKSETS